MPTNDWGDLARAKEQMYERLRTHGGMADKAKAQDWAQRTQDRVERRKDAGQDQRPKSR